MWGFHPKGNLLSAYMVKKTLRKLLPEDVYVPPFLDDRQYFIPTDPAYVMKKIKSYNHIPIADKWGRIELKDCNHFNRIFRGILSQKGWGRLLALDLGIETPDLSEKHGLIGFLNPMMDGFVLGEPQTGKIVDFSEYKILRAII